MSLRDKLAGRKVVYHGTRLNNLESIYDKGIQGKRTDDPNSYTKKSLVSTEPDSEKRKYRGLAYTTGDKKYADSFGKNRHELAHNGIDGKYGKTLKITIPRSEYKKLKKVGNPEYGPFNDYISGKITKDQLAKTLTGKAWKDLSKEERKPITLSIPTIKKQLVVRGNIKPEWIVGSAKYKKAGRKEIIDNLLRRK